MRLDELTAYQKDALKEVGNIGAGNAAGALSQMVHKPVKMMVPSVSTVPYMELPEAIGSPETAVVAVYTPVVGECPGNMLLLLDLKEAQSLVRTLLDRDIDIEDGGLPEVERSAFEEIGNILASSYINSLAQFTHIQMTARPPAFAMDMLGAVLNQPIQESVTTQDYVLLINTLFKAEGTQINGHVLYIPRPGSLEKILSAIGVKV